MRSKEAYNAIRKALASNPRTSIVECTYDTAAFGNFLIAFEADGEPKSVVNDRGELVLCGDLAGTRNCETVVPSINDVNERMILKALGL